ncbi:uncharacterized protein [Typha latifolia]|uniref:uncharacterized protein n=1 Tax=Typha latifolia TaxID=4733 RepID=UPI003C2AB09C
MSKSLVSCLRLRKPCDVSTAEAAFFCSWLADELRRLEQSLEKDSVSLKWSIQAMGFLKMMHVELLALFRNSGLPISYGAEEDWFHHYMQETATLLDFCNSLKSAVSAINRYRMVVDFTVQALTRDGSSINVSKSGFERLERGQEKTFDVKVAKEAPRLGSGISTCNRKDDKGSGAIGYNSPVLQPCFDLLSAITERFRERFSRSEGEAGLVLVEHRMVAEVLRDLKAQVVGGVVMDRELFLRGLEMLRTRSIGLREGVEMFESMVDKVFDEVVRGRNEMLGIFRDEALI